MASVTNHLVEFKLYNVESNMLGNTGCEILSRAYWPQLRNLKLANNNIKSEGAKHLRRSNWPLLNIIDISKNLMLRLKPHQERRLPIVL